MADSSAAVNFVRSYDGFLYWVESRPWDNGRNLIFRMGMYGEIEELIPAHFSNQS